MKDDNAAIPKDMTSIKLWIPIIHKIKNNDLLLVKGSHKKNYKYKIKDTSYGQKPYVDTKFKGVQLLSKANTVLLFNENMLHKGSINKDIYTRVSVEITILIKNDTIKLLPKA